MLASMLLIELIVHFWPQRVNVISEGVEGNPLPLIVTSYPPLRPPELAVTEVKSRPMTMGLTELSIVTSPSYEMTTWGKWLPTVRTGVLSEFLGKLQVKLVIEPVKPEQG